MNTARIKKKIAVLISGKGSNLQALINAQSGYNYEIGLVTSNRPNALGLKRAQQAKIKTLILDHTLYSSREEFDADLIKAIDFEKIDFVILAGFMRILTTKFTLHYLGKMLNIHPSLLPKYPGLHTHKKALEAGDKEHGVSIHFVTPELDSGPVTLQAKIKIEDCDTEESLQAKIHIEEHKIYPLATHWLVSNQLTLNNNQAFFKGQLIKEELKKPLPFAQRTPND